MIEIGTLIERIFKSGDGDAKKYRDILTLIKHLEHEGEFEVGNKATKDVVYMFNDDNYKAAHKWSKVLRAKIREELGKKADADMYDLYKEVLKFDARSDFDSYCLFLEWNRPAYRKFYAPRRSVLLPIVEDLQRLYDGELDFLGVSLPPRSGKSTLCIFFMSWLMGNRPMAASVMSGHSDKLTEPFFREVLNILTDDTTYLWKEVFPDVHIHNVSAKNEQIDLGTKSRFPTFTARSVSGTLTGAVEIGTGGCLYCDDLIEDREESLSPERLDNKYNAYLNQLKDRKKDGAFELMVGTRWNVLDPLGRIEQQYRDNPRYKFDVIPAVDEEGHSNFNYPYNLGFSDEYYADMKASIDDAEWCAKYMGNPYIREGLLYPAESLRRFFETPDREPDAVVAVCDPAQGGGDDTFMPIFAQYGEDHYLVDCVCSPAMPEVVDGMCAEALIKNAVQLCQFEVNSGGGRAADNCEKRLKERGGTTRITKKQTQANKETKIYINSGWIKEHVLFLDDRRIQAGSQYQRMMRLLSSYVVVGNNKTDDVPDGLAQYALYQQREVLSNRIVVARRPF